MSSPLGIAGVTAVLCNLLDNGLIEAQVPGAIGAKVKVTAQPPDNIKINDPGAQAQLNLFLHEVTPNAAWRNAGLPSRDASGDRLKNPPLALDLHYLLTAYGVDDLQAEILLGYAMHLLHETPVLDRQAIRKALGGGAVSAAILPPAFQALTASDLAEQVEQIRVIPVTLGTEEMSKLWSALQAHYRPTAAYQVSVVLIESRHATRAALPVLTRGGWNAAAKRERGFQAVPNLEPPYPTLTGVTVGSEAIPARPGDTITVAGLQLDGDSVRVRFEHARLDNPIEIPFGAHDEPETIAISLPDTAASAAAWPAGTWGVSVSLVRPGEQDARVTNAVPMQLAPILDLSAPATTVVRGGTPGPVTVRLGFRPLARPGQTVSLDVGGVSAPAESFAAATGRLDFVFPRLAAGAPWARLRIDGVDSRLVIRVNDEPVFDPSQRLTVPA